MPVTRVCENCNIEFQVKPRDASRKFCSRDCQRVYELAHGRAATRKPPIVFACKNCGNSFTMGQSYVTAYRKKFGKDPLYCSMPCSDAGRKKDAENRNSFTCKQCGKAQPLRRRPSGNLYYQQQFCNPQCHGEWKKVHALEKFESGNIRRHIKRHGYVWISVPSLVTGKKHEMLEHRYVMEQHLGRKLLPEETVHHRDGNRQHNLIGNLELFSSRHGPGQRVIDKVAFAIDMLRTYPEFAKAQGAALIDVAA